MPLHFEETRQQERPAFEDAMADLENETIKRIYQICCEYNKGNMLPTAALFAAHVVTCISKLQEEEALPLTIEPEESKDD